MPRTVTTFLASLDFDGEDGVAGVDRTLEGRGVDDLGDFRELHHVELRRDARGDVLAGRGGGGEEGVVAGHHRHDEGFDSFGQGMR